MENNSAYWLDIVDYDLVTAEAMYSTGRWLYVGFMCHQVIEKVLKAYWCGTCEDDPPYTHNHSRLAQGCGLWDELTEEQKDFLETVTTFNIEARYPKYKEELSRRLSKEACRDIIDKTNVLQLWIRERLSEKTKHSNS